MEKFTDKEFCLEVWGPMACFTRPEFKVERVSYEIITPSAARNIFQAIFWKKYAMEWEISRIDVLNPIRWMSVRRNEIGATIGKKTTCIYIEDKGKRQQRNSLMLRDVRYRIWAKLRYIPVQDRPKEAFAKHEPDKNENPGKYQAMFERRASQGQCYTIPYLGTRECSAFFRLVDLAGEKLEPALPSEQGGDREFGYILYDVDYSRAKSKGHMFFDAKMRNGTIIVPPRDSKEVLR